MKNIKRLAFVMVLSFTWARWAHAQVIDTTAGFAFNSGVGRFGEGDNETFGQTFRAPMGFERLDQFTLWLRPSLGPDAVDFAAYVMEWNTALNRAAGPFLFESTQQIDAVSAAATFTPYVFDTGGLALDPAKQYVAFFSVTNYLDGINGSTFLAYRGADVYSGGNFVFLHNGNSFVPLTTNSWGPGLAAGAAGNDLAFRAQFSSAVPEPATYGVLASLALFGAITGRRPRIGARSRG